MLSLQNPFEFAASDAAADTAVASISQPLALDVAATHFEFGAHAVCAPDEAAASFRQTSDAAATFDCLMDDICEIFAGARKMFDPDPAAYTREDELYYDVLKAMDDPHTADLIEMPYGMEGIFDPPPLFLRQTG